MNTETKQTAGKKNDFSPVSYIAAGYAIILLGLGGLGTWAATAPLASGIIAPGTVSVETNRKTIQHLEGGIIAEILVKDGDVVDAGDVLMRVDPTEAQGDYAVLESRFILLQATEARLMAESIDASYIVWPEDLSAGPQAEAVKAAMALQSTLFEDRKRIKDGQTAIMRARIKQIHEAVLGLQQQLIFVDQQVASMEGEIGRLASGEEKGVIGTNQLSQTTRGFLALKGGQGEIAADIARQRQTVLESELQIVQIRQQFLERAGSELRDIREQLAEVTERRNVAMNVLERTTVRAPVRGMVQSVRVHTTNGIIRSAEPILDIIPVDDDLVVNARVRPIDVDNVQIGDRAEVRFPAFSGKTTPAIFGRLMFVSQDVMEPQQVGQEPYYQASIEVDYKEVPLEIRERLLPGMPADLIISTGERTFADYILSPLVDSFHKSMRER